MSAAGRIALATLVLGGCATRAPAGHTDAQFKVAMSDDLPVKSKTQGATTEKPGRPRSTHTFPSSYPGTEALPVVRSGHDVTAHDGKVARVVRTYIEVDARMRPTPPARFVGHAGVRLADGTVLSLLPIWDSDALRPQSEIDQFKDRTVEIVGTIYAEAPADPNGAASPTGPSVDDIKALRSAP